MRRCRPIVRVSDGHNVLAALHAALLVLRYARCWGRGILSRDVDAALNEMVLLYGVAVVEEKRRDRLGMQLPVKMESVALEVGVRTVDGVAGKGSAAFRRGRRYQGSEVG